jgi:ribonuclease HII
MPDFSFETEAADQGYTAIAGVDEVGRGPLCGPVTAAAVILDPDRIPDGLRDSKKLTDRKRRLLFTQIMDTAMVGVAHASVAEIDEINILQASHLAMVRAIGNLPKPADFALIDGNRAPKNLIIPSTCVVKGDDRSLSIAAASIVAKITRDDLMLELDAQYPGYGWAKNAGYPTKEHLVALKSLGITPHHRRSFKPVHNILYQEE